MSRAGAPADTSGFPREGRRHAAPERWRWQEDGAAASVLLFATIALYHRALGLWWYADHFFHLRYLREWRSWQYFLDPSAWEQFPARLWTPLLLLSLELDEAWFGAQPAGYYVHQLLALGAAAVAFFALLRLWLVRRWALAGALLFLLGAPVAVLTPLLARHYVEGLALALLSAIAWVLSVRHGGGWKGWSLAGLSALLWLASALAKEIAVPMVLVLPLVGEAPLAVRLRRSFPHAVALSLYVVGRWWMLGGLAEGYGWAPEPRELWRLAAGLPIAVAREVFAGPWIAGWFAAAALCVGLALAAARARGALLLGGGLALALLPIVPVASAMSPRYALAAWVVLVLGFVSGASRLSRGLVLAGIAALALVPINRRAWAQQLAEARRSSAENLALAFDLGPGDGLRRALGPSASRDELRRFARLYLGREVSARWFADDAYLCLPGPGLRRLWEFDPAEGRVADATARLPGLRRRACARLRRVVPLAASFRRDGEALRWELGPYRDGRWWLVFDNGVEAVVVPRRGGFRTPHTVLRLRVRYDSPSGSTAYSPELRPDFSRGDRWSWRQPAR